VLTRKKRKQPTTLSIWTSLMIMMTNANRGSILLVFCPQCFYLKL
jgi:hypothetical protein